MQIFSGKPALALFGGVIFVFGIGLGVIFTSQGAASNADTSCAKTFSLTSDELDCGYDDNRSRLHALDSQFDQATAEYVSEGKATRVSVWVRDLKSKQWAASNENELYSPASLLKVPLLVAYYKFSELSPSVLDQPVVYQPSKDLNDNYNYFTATSSLVTSQTYSTGQLIEDMMERSDNGASLALLQGVEPAFYNKTLTDLGIQIPSQNDTLDFVTVKTYSNIFRILYNASYLNRDLSQKALDLMTHSSFKGIAEPLPEGVVVAHKFGERTVVDPDGTISKRELHDCGIVYKQPHPYTLCIMAEGQNFDDLLSVIRDLSSIAYQQM